MKFKLENLFGHLNGCPFSNVELRTNTLVNTIQETPLASQDNDIIDHKAYLIPEKTQVKETLF